MLTTIFAKSTSRITLMLTTVFTKSTARITLMLTTIFAKSTLRITLMLTTVFTKSTSRITLMLTTIFTLRNHMKPTVRITRSLRTIITYTMRRGSTRGLISHQPRPLRPQQGDFLTHLLQLVRLRPHHGIHLSLNFSLHL